MSLRDSHQHGSDTSDNEKAVGRVQELEINADPDTHLTAAERASIVCQSILTGLLI
jgi:hypothetical protein